MSEYEYVVEFGYKPPNANGGIIKEEIVRCRDCKFSRIHDGKRYPGKKAKGRMYCINWCDGYGADWTKPDGFCHRAKRKEGGE